MSPKKNHRHTSLGLIAGVLLAASTSLLPAMDPAPLAPGALAEARAALEEVNSIPHRAQKHREGVRGLDAADQAVVVDALRVAVRVLAASEPQSPEWQEATLAVDRASGVLRLRGPSAEERAAIWRDAAPASAIPDYATWRRLYAVSGGCTGARAALLELYRAAPYRTAERDNRLALGFAMSARSGYFDTRGATEHVVAMLEFVDEVTGPAIARMRTMPAAEWPSAIEPWDFGHLVSRVECGLMADEELFDLAGRFLAEPASWRPEAAEHLEMAYNILVRKSWEYPDALGEFMGHLEAARSSEDGHGAIAAHLPLAPPEPDPSAVEHRAALRDFAATVAAN